MPKDRDKTEAPEAEEILRDYFSSAAHVAGLKAAALERASTGTDLPQDWRLIERLRDRRKKIAAHRATRSVLQAIGNAHVTALWLAYGSHESCTNFVEDLKKDADADNRFGRHPGTNAVLKELRPELIGLALRSRALGAALADWLRGERGKFADVAVDAASADLAERTWTLLGARSILRARVAAGLAAVAVPLVDRVVPVALAETDDLRERMLERVCRDGKRRVELDAVRAEADATRTRALVVFARAAGYPVREVLAPDGEPRTRAPRPVKPPSWFRREGDSAEAVA